MCVDDLYSNRKNFRNHVERVIGTLKERWMLEKGIYAVPGGSAIQAYLSMGTMNLKKNLLTSGSFPLPLPPTLCVSKF